MRVLVTGASGRIGRQIAPHLARLGHEVITTTRDPSRAGRSSTRFFDLSEVPTPRLVQDIDAVVHLAAESNPRSSAQGSTLDQMNHIATKNLAEKAAEAQVSCFVFASSVRVFGAAPTHAISSDSPLQPDDAYSRSKAAAEACLTSLAGDMTIRILRLASFREDSVTSPQATSFVKKLWVCPVSVPDNARLVASPDAVKEAIAASLRDSQHLTRTLVADRQVGFHEEARAAAERLGLRRVFLPIPRSVWRGLDRVAVRLGAPSTAAIYADLTRAPTTHN